MYLNFSRNTNFSERRGLYNDYENKEWTIVDNPELKIDDYQSSVEKYRFIMCPWGNGVDTHRVWETLYSGNIPVTKEHHTFSTSLGLPVLFIHDYDDITLKKLTNFYDEKKDTENIYEKLDINYWIDNIKNFNKNITIELNDLDSHIKLIINDNGVGFKNLNNNIKEILNPYFTTKKKGTGLGLSIVNKIINDHNGNIEFISMDDGAKIKITFVK